MLKKSRINQSGFSLIELMVVVAIIGILAAIGIPQYSKFQAKTRQSEAKSSLSTLYTSQTSFLGEWNQYTVNLRNIGFGVTGSRLRYITGFFNMVAAVPYGCTGYVTTGGAPQEIPTGVTTVVGMLSSVGTTCGTAVNVGSSPATFVAIAGPTWTAAQTCAFAAMPSGATNQAVVTAAAVTPAATCTATATAQAFVAHSVGDPNANAATFLDGWSINNLKTLSNSTPGIN